MAKFKQRAQRKRSRLDRKRNAATLQQNYRTLRVRAETINEDDRSVEVVLATENAVDEMDWEWYRVVPHYLLMSGADLPSGRQIPLLESHARYSLQTQLGSIRGLKKVTLDGQRVLVGRAHFSEVAADEWTKVREGHVTDLSVGYRTRETVRIPEGETRTVKGRRFEGPAIVITRSRVFEGSVLPIGADEQAKMRGLDPNNLPARTSKDGAFTMNEKLRALCVERGMDASLSDDDAQAWLVDNHERAFAAAAPPSDPPADPPADPAPGPAASGEHGRSAPPALSADGIQKLVADAIAGHEADRQRQQAEFRSDVDELLKLVDMEHLRSDCYALSSIADVRNRIATQKAERQEQLAADPGITFSASQPADRGRAALQTALNYRALSNSARSQETIDKVFPESERAKDWEHFRHGTLLDMSRDLLQMQGFNTRGLTPEQIAKAALGFHEQAGIRLRAGGAALHVTGSFANLTRDAVNKSMQVGYTEAPQTWLGPMRQGTSVPDFKTIHRVRLGAIPNLPVWADNEDPEKASFADAEETYAVEARSLEVSFSWRLIVNDDMDALSRIPSQMGNAAARTVNKVAWAVVTANDTMSDTVALFSAASGNRKQSNLTTGASSPPAKATVGTMKKLMRLMRGENTPGDAAQGNDVLNLEPTYLVGPAALETEILELTRSQSDPADNKSSGVVNVHRNLTPVIEPLLDDNSATAYYLFASPMQIDTVEVTFLQGQETPLVSDYMDPKNFSQCFTIVSTFAAKALNHRGIQKHTGAA